MDSYACELCNFLLCFVLIILGYDLAKRHLSIGSHEYEEQENYFNVYSKDLLIKAFSRILIKQTSKLGCSLPDFQVKTIF